VKRGRGEEGKREERKRGDVSERSGDPSVAEDVKL